MDSSSIADVFNSVFALPTLVLLGAAVVIGAIEAWVLFVHRRAGWARARAVLTNVVVAALEPIGGVVGLAIWFPAFRWVHDHSPIAVPVAWWSAVVAVVLADFFDYWSHRASHESRWLWAIGHSVHHSANVMDQSVGLRVSFVEGIVTPAFYVPAALIVHPVLLIGAVTFTLVYQQWLHTELIGKLGWFDRWFDSPSSHRVHHGSNPQYLDRNYGSFSLVWDRIFGTYTAEVEPVTYGLVEPVRSNNPWTVHTVGLRRLLQRRTARLGRA